ncbi:MAG: LPS export ABC transporter periplasmic protein LptC [Deltaproteobacteria bacterium]|jgi:LPS export ABC transporter protein LptC|nr:LPS export ABC transporter periplasmic protein LptC [Deltaproteobacteria bacterium]
MSRVRFIILSVLGILVAMLGVLLWNAKNLSGLKLGNLQDMLPANVDMRLGNLVLSETGANGRSLSVLAETAQYYKDDDYFILNSVKADIASQSGKYKISSEKGRYDPARKLVVLTGSVRTSDDKGRIITSPTMELNMDSGTFSSPVEFCLEDPDISLSGKNFNYDTSTGQLEVEGRVFMLITQ